MDHQMIMSELKGEKVRRNHRYCKGRTTWTIMEPKGVLMQEEYTSFDNLQMEVKKPT